MFIEMNEITLRILRVLIRNPKKEFYQREISKLAKVSLGATNYTIKELSSFSIVKERKVGRMCFYKINNKHPIVYYLKILLNIIDLLPLVVQLKSLTKKLFYMEAVQMEQIQ